MWPKFRACLLTAGILLAGLPDRKKNWLSSTLTFREKNYKNELFFKFIFCKWDNLVIFFFPINNMIGMYINLIWFLMFWHEMFFPIENNAPTDLIMLTKTTYIPSTCTNKCQILKSHLSRCCVFSLTNYYPFCGILLSMSSILHRWRQYN
jgi:hypothetical protein